ncbi:MAG: sigma 54-interacting transcriptional regulator, partial [Anaerohalosphaera sp.]|nr:sigma 54-interacting transcriptional regulator [Anaerohalosphaera sp.]
MVFENIVIVGNQQHTQSLLQTACSTMLVADDVSEAADIIGTNDPDLVIFDNAFGPEEITDFLNHQNLSIKAPPVVVLNHDNDNGYSSQHYDNTPIAGYIRHDDPDSDITSALKNLFYNKNEDEYLDFFCSDIAANAGIVGKSKAMAHTLKMTETVAKSNCNPVLVIGKTGTGKEGIAKAVHDIRHNNDNFIAINCAALTATLLESELFGHVKGSFTGAVS